MFSGKIMRRGVPCEGAYWLHTLASGIEEGLSDLAESLSASWGTVGVWNNYAPRFCYRDKGYSNNQKIQRAPVTMVLLAVVVVLVRENMLLALRKVVKSENGWRLWCCRDVDNVITLSVGSSLSLLMVSACFLFVFLRGGGTNGITFYFDE